MIRNNILLFLLLMGWNLLPAQSVVLSEVSDELETFEKHYIYPSVLRALASTQDQSFNELIQDVELVRILRVDSTFIDSNQKQIDQLSSKLIDEGYEIIGSANEKKVLNELFLYEKEDRIAGFIISRKEENSLLIVELIGNLNLNKVQDLMNMDLSNFSTILGE